MARLPTPHRAKRRPAGLFRPVRLPYGQSAHGPVPARLPRRGLALSPIRQTSRTPRPEQQRRRQTRARRQTKPPPLLNPHRPSSPPFFAFASPVVHRPQAVRSREGIEEPRGTLRTRPLHPTAVPPPPIPDICRCHGPRGCSHLPA